MATSGQGRLIVTSFAENLSLITKLAEAGDIAALCAVIEDNRRYLSEPFLKERMRQALAVDATLGRVLSRGIDTKGV